MLYEKCLENPLAKVVKVDTHMKSKWRPLPLNTIELQKLAAKKLGISSSRLMDIAEKLYNKGFISYPRTETDFFQKSINLKDLVSYQEDSPDWGPYAQKLIQNNIFLWPRNGTHNDNAHPPIHPVKHLEKNQGLAPDEWKVYELITRHFLACCSQDAKGQERLIDIVIGEERFTAKGMIITEYNYLEIYIYEKWVETPLPELSLQQTFIPTGLLLKEGRTTAPSLLTEAELITVMDRNGIGTDATIAEHIKTIQERGYAQKQQGSFFVPTSLGLALVESYEDMGLELAKPKLRAEMERAMKEIVQGRKNKEQVVKDSVLAMYEVYIQISSRRQVFIENIRRFYQETNNSSLNNENNEEAPNSEVDQNVDLGNCSNCQQRLVLIRSEFSRKLSCRSCDKLMLLPKQGEITKVSFICPLCNSQVLY